MKTCFLYFILILLTSRQAFAERCTYNTWEWDTVAKKAVHHQKVTKLKADLSDLERGETSGCTVCEEDQTEIRLDGLPVFKICKTFQDRIIRAINKSRSHGFPIHSIVGYRVGKSKGPLSASGLRTQFSNHSFGTAIDFNSEKNGLYDSCVQFGPECKLLRGGEYRRDMPGSITQESILYKAMLNEGLKWGGEINGKQKDFMHFSIDGM